MISNLDELLFGSRSDPLRRLRLDGVCVPFALLEPSLREAEAFFLGWFREAHRIAAPLAEQAAPPVWRPFALSMRLAAEELEAALQASAPSNGLLLEGLKDDSRTLAAEWIRRGRSLREAIDAAVQRREGSDRQQARQAVELLAEAAEELGIERQERLREASQILHAQLAGETAGGEPVLRLLAGWTSMERGFQDQALAANLFQACLSLGARGGAPAWFAGRTLAEAYRRQERWAEAAEALAFALGASPDPETRWAAAAALAEAERTEEAAHLAADCLRAMPSLAAGIWALPCLEAARPRLGLAASQVARVEQQRAREALARWRAEIERSRAGLAQAGLPAELPGALEKDWILLSQAAGQHLLQDRYVATIADDRARDLRELTVRRLTEAYDAQLDRWRREVEEMDRERRQYESRVEGAIRRKDEDEGRIRQRLAAFGGTADHLQTGCAWGLGVGCAGLSLYVVVVVATALGRPLRVENPLAIILFALVLAPGAIALLLTIGFSLRYLALEAEAHAALRGVRQDFEAAIAELQREHAEAVRRGRERVDAARKEVLQVERAFAALGLAVPERPGWIPELPPDGR
ncbi:MAG: hypothetical protein N2109_08620 [Fimbriimonadales bacterium]|nr:hypothetical protein [Fimbriimonadales bacterium]